MVDGGVQMQPLGQPGEPCEQCAAPLAADQRYCLNCGKRRGGPRVDYRQQMLPSTDSPGSDRSQPVADTTQPTEAKSERDYAPLAAVGGIAVLGLMLLVGVLIGKGDSSGTATTPAPIVRVGGEGSESNTADSASGSNEGGSKSAGFGGGGGKKAKGGGNKAAAGEGTVQATTNDLNELESQSGASYEEQAKKLPDKIATPGKPPPIDKSKPPGGGEGGAVTIK